MHVLCTIHPHNAVYPVWSGAGGLVLLLPVTAVSHADHRTVTAEAGSSRPCSTQTPAVESRLPGPGCLCAASRSALHSASPAQPTNDPIYRRTDEQGPAGYGEGRAGEDRQPRPPTHKDHHRPSDRPSVRASAPPDHLHQCLRGRAVNDTAAGQCRRVARPRACSRLQATVLPPVCPPTAARSALPMTYRPPAAATAAFAAAMPCPPAIRPSTEKSRSEIHTNDCKIELNPTCLAAEDRRRYGCAIVVVVVVIVPVVTTPLAVRRRLLAGRHRLDSRSRRRHLSDELSSKNRTSNAFRDAANRSADYGPSAEIKRAAFSRVN